MLKVSPSGALNHAELILNHAQLCTPSFLRFGRTQRFPPLRSKFSPQHQRIPGIADTELPSSRHYWAAFNSDRRLAVLSLRARLFLVHQFRTLWRLRTRLWRPLQIMKSRTRQDALFRLFHKSHGLDRRREPRPLLQTARGDRMGPLMINRQLLHPMAL